MAKTGRFPTEWKRASLLLLRKGDKPVNEPSSYRPICLLDVEGKLYEQLIVARLNNDLRKTGDLSDNQFGFRKNRQTVDAIRKVITIAGKAAAYASRNRKLCAMITIDVKNAFNSASWQLILEELRKRKVDEALINVIASYLADRVILLQTEGKNVEKQVNSGVPQGSVLGPTLWNILYDELFEIEQPDGVTVVGFADDAAVLVVAQNEDQLMSKANIALQNISKWMSKKRLELAPQKTEAILLTKKRKIEPICFEIQGTVVTPTRALKYLGVWLDTKLSFNTHVDVVTQKAERTMTALTGLMPNVGGPRSSKRRVLSSVVLSQILYAAPVWGTATKNKGICKRLKRVQRASLIRITSAYRTISTDAAGVIAGVPPIDLLVQERTMKYDGNSREEARESILLTWQQRWETAEHGRWTFQLIPEIKKWLNRSHGEADYFLTQALSGHGCFRKFLHGRKRAESSGCPYCGQMDDAEHTLFRCEKWGDLRESYEREAGLKYEAGNIVPALTSGEAAWNLTYNITRAIIERKEADVRQLT